MAIPDERLVLEASVTDDFTDTLATLSEGLAEIDRLAAETVEDINADVDIASAMDDLTALDAGIEAVEDDVDIEADVDDTDDFTDTLLELSGGLAEIDRLAAETVEDITADVDIASAMDDLAALDAGIQAVEDDIDVDTDVDGIDTGSIAESIHSEIGLSPREAAGVDEFLSPYQVGETFSGDPDPSVGDGGGGAGAVGDGGGGPDPLGVEDIKQAQRMFGDAFDPSEILSDRDTRRYADLLEDGLTEHLDGDAVFNALINDDNPLELGDLQDAFGMGDEGAGGIGQLLRADVLDLPEESDSLFEQFRDLELVMGDFFQVFASIIPLLGIFIGAIPAVVGGLLGLAGAALAASAALAGVAGLAVLGAAVSESGELQTQQLTERIGTFFDRALENLAPLANDFAPLVDTTLRSLNRTLARLAQRGDAIRSVTDEFTAALAFIEANAPGALARLVRFGEAAMPILGGIIREIGNMEILNSLAIMLRQTMPLLSLLTKAIVGMLGPLFQFSRGFLIVATMLTVLASGFLQLLDALGPVLPALGLLTSVILGLVSATALYTVATSGAVGSAIGLAGSLLTYLVPASGAATTALTSMGLSAAAASAAVSLLGGAILVVFAAVGLLIFSMTGLSETFNDLTGDINEATDALKAFGNAEGRVGGTSFGSPSVGASGASTGGYQSASDITVVAADKQEGNAIANSLGFNGVGSDTSTNDNVANRVHNG